MLKYRKKQIKWKNKAGTFVAKELSATINVKLSQFTKIKEFDIRKIYLFKDDAENIT